MGIYVGERMSTRAALTALNIDWTMDNIVKPALADYFTAYAKSGYELRYATGIDRSAILAVLAGQRKDNDLIWIGRAPNLAARLSELQSWPNASWS